MSNNKKAIKVLVGIGIVGAIIWFATKPKTKAQMIDYLVSNKYTKSKDFVSTFDDAFIKAWYDAAKAKSEKFIYNGLNHWVEGGTVVMTR
jgi:hypothetical protein